MTSYENGKEPKILKRGDIVTFKVKDMVLEYEVSRSFLNMSAGAINRKIFEVLGLNATEFCKKYYGYKPYDGDWPESKPDDFEALTRVVKALFKIINPKKSIKELMEVIE